LGDAAERLLGMSKLAQERTSGRQRLLLPAEAVGKQAAHVIDLLRDLIQFEAHRSIRRPLYRNREGKAK
jgi:hypothetical protein